MLRQGRRELLALPGPPVMWLLTAQGRNSSQLGEFFQRGPARQLLCRSWGGQGSPLRIHLGWLWRVPQPHRKAGELFFPAIPALVWPSHRAQTPPFHLSGLQRAVETKEQPGAALPRMAGGNRAGLKPPLAVVGA